MIEKKEIVNEKTILIGTIKPGETDELINEQLSELELLAETAGAEVIGKITQRISKINSATFIGKGKSIQIINQAIELKAKLIIFDDELSPAQIKNYHN
ncbi:MAG: GTPase HflX, partial [Candidatus Neomarinimicrobiota bacterium]